MKHWKDKTTKITTCNREYKFYSRRFKDEWWNEEGWNWYWKGGKNLGMPCWKVRRYRSWKYNRKRQWK